MSFATGALSITKEDILSRVSEFNILSYYFGVTEIPCFIQSPLRVDKNPSLGLYTLNGHKIYYRDMSTMERGGTWDLLGNYWNLDYNQVLEKVYREIDRIPNHVSSKVVVAGSDNRVVCKKGTKLECKVREWQQHDIEYWEQYGISLEWLKFGEVYPISRIIITSSDRQMIKCADKYAYVYVERKDGNVTIKIYQPFSDKHKWSNNHNSSVWDLWTKLPKKGEHLIITSSRKDALCIWENSGIPSVSLQAESYLPKEKVVNELKERFNKVYVLYDNDFQSEVNHGHNLGNLMAKQFDLIQIEIPLIYQSKDTSDLAKNHGREIVREVIHNLIKEE
jgi:hypothetical protein